MPVERHPLTDIVIGGAIAVHRSLGAGLFESVYEHCMCEELDLARVRFERQVPLPLKYKRANFPIAFRVDLIVEDWLIVELKAVERLLPVHEAQVLTYMRLSGAKQALLINFNVPILKDGLRSYLNGNPHPFRTPLSPLPPLPPRQDL